MAEFCMDCWNEMMGANDPPKKFRISRELDLCEKWGQWKRVIISVRKRYILRECFADYILYLRMRHQKNDDATYISGKA